MVSASGERWVTANEGWSSQVAVCLGEETEGGGGGGGGACPAIEWQ